MGDMGLLGTPILEGEDWDLVEEVEDLWGFDGDENLLLFVWGEEGREGRWG